MSEEAQRELVHKVNNLLSVIYTQVEVGRSQGTLEAAMSALSQIQRTAEATLPYVKRAVDRSSGQSSGSSCDAQ